MSAKLKEFISNIRSCKTTDEIKNIIMTEKAAIRQSFQKNKHLLKPRNLVKLLFINLQGHDTSFGQIESLNLACRNSFIEKKIGYLTMSIFLHEKSEMLMMATNRISLDLDHPNLYIRGLALSTFSSIADSDMARQISPKIIKLIKNDRMGNSLNSFDRRYDDPYQIDSVQKKALLSGFRVLQKCPELYEMYIDVIIPVFKLKNHGVWISAMNLFCEIFKLSAKYNNGTDKLFTVLPIFIDKIKSLIAHLDPDYVINGVNDPFLIISLIRQINNVLIHSKKYKLDVDVMLIKEIEKLIVYAIGMFRPNKKTVNSVLYELARLALFFKNSEELTSCGFHILNQLMETKESSPNFKFASLNLLKNFENYSESALKMLDSHCELVMCILQKNDEDNSLRTLALQVLPKIISSSNLFKILENLKSLLLTEQSYSESNNQKHDLEFEKAIISNIFYMLDHKANKYPLKRVEESLKLLLIVDNKVSEENLSNLITVICNNEEIQINVIEQIWKNFNSNWKQRGFFKLASYILGEFSELIEDGNLNFGIDSVLNTFLDLSEKIQGNDCKCYLINSLAKILAKSKNINQNLYNRCLKVFFKFKKSEDTRVQNRANEYHLILTCNELSKEDKKEIFASMPLYVFKEEKPEEIHTNIIKFTDNSQKKDFSDKKKEKKIEKIILTDSELTIKLKYNKTSDLKIEGFLSVSNNTSTSIYNMTALLIGLDCPSLNFENEKIDIFESKKEKLWNFKINLGSSKAKSCKLKYVVRFYYNKNNFSEDYRMNKEGIYDFDINFEKEIQNTQNDNFLNLNAPSSSQKKNDEFDFFNSLKEPETKKIEKEETNLLDLNFL